MDLRQSQEQPDSFVVIDESLPIESIGEDLSLEEAIVRLRELTRQNEELRKTVDSNSKIMKKQIQVLQEWKAGWEADKMEVKEKHEQARQVVVELRADVAKKDAKIDTLNNRLKEMESLKSAASATVEQQELITLQQQITSLEKQVQDLKEDNDRLASAKDEVCRDVDQHTKIVSELQLDKTNLVEENRNLQQRNDALTQDIKGHMDKAEKFNAEKQELVEQIAKLREYNTLVGGAQEVVSDALPASSHSGLHSNGSMDKNMAELMANLQDLRTENRELKQSVEQRLQEMDAMHRKMDSEAERMVNMEHEHRQAANRLENDYQREIEQLKADLSKLRSQQSPRSSFDGSVTSVEEMKALKTQVISLTKEIDSSNEKIKALEELLGQQKDRVQAMEAKSKSQVDEAELDRNKADELITKLQQSISSLETALANEKHDNNAKTVALAENRKKFAQLLNDYHDSMTQVDELKRQLEQVKAGGGPQQAQIDNLLAQVMAADESMAHKADEITRLKRERDDAFAEFDKVTQLLPVLKAQCDIYKKDFESERAAREKMHQEKEALKEESEQLHATKMRLEEELSEMSAVQLRMVRDKHGVNRQEAGGHAEQLPHAAAPAAPTTVHSGHESLPTCPICNQLFPDTDTLQLHVNDCLTESAAN